MKPYDRHSDVPASVRKFKRRAQRRHARAVQTTVGRRRRHEQLMAEVMAAVLIGAAAKS